MVSTLDCQAPGPGVQLMCLGLRVGGFTVSDAEFHDISMQGKLGLCILSQFALLRIKTSSLPPFLLNAAHTLLSLTRKTLTTAGLRDGQHGGGDVIRKSCDQPLQALKVDTPILAFCDRPTRAPLNPRPRTLVPKPFKPENVKPEP